MVVSSLGSGFSSENETDITQFTNKMIYKNQSASKIYQMHKKILAKVTVRTLCMRTVQQWSKAQ